jgi:excinuclease UvrABC ATPase subunit
MKDLREIKEDAPHTDGKCDACRGEGELPVFDVHGEQRGIARCPICGGARHAP